MTWPSYWPVTIHEVASAQPQRRTVLYYNTYVACVYSQSNGHDPTNKICDFDMAKQYPLSPKEKSEWKSTSNMTTNRMLLMCRYPNPQHLLIPIITSLPSNTYPQASHQLSFQHSKKRKEKKEEEAYLKPWQPPPSNNQHSPARLL